MAADENLANRVMNLELMVMHLQRDLETLNAVLLEQRKENDLFRLKIEKMENQFVQWSVQGEKFDIENDRPPHF